MTVRLDFKFFYFLKLKMVEHLHISQMWRCNMFQTVHLKHFTLPCWMCHKLTAKSLVRQLFVAMYQGFGTYSYHLLDRQPLLMPSRSSLKLFMVLLLINSNFSFVFFFFFCDFYLVFILLLLLTAVVFLFTSLWFYRLVFIAYRSL